MYGAIIGDIVLATIPSHNNKKSMRSSKVVNSVIYLERTGNWRDGRGR